ASVTAGTKYAIVVYSPGAFGDAVGAWYQNSDVYPGGSLFENLGSLPPGGTWTDLLEDLAFKTYVAPTPPPTGQRAAALKRCKKKRSARARKKCKKRANLLPV